MYCRTLQPSTSIHVGNYRHLTDLVKVEEAVKIASGKCKTDLTLDRGRYNSRLARILPNSANDKRRTYMQQQRCRWIPSVKGQIVYGIYPVLEALKARRRQVHKLYYKPNLVWADSAVRRENLENILSLANSNGIGIKELQIRQLNALCGDQIHNGVCIDAEPLQFESIECIDSNCQGPLVFFDNVLDTFNIGAIIRSCAFFGVVATVMALNAGPKAITPAMSRASAGTIEWLPMYKVPSTERFLQQAKSLGYVVIGTFDESSLKKRNMQNVVPIEDLKLAEPKTKFILVLGNEHDGLSNAASKQCQYITSIRNSNPTSFVNSLNVSAAAAILLHHLQM